MNDEKQRFNSHHQMSMADEFTIFYSGDTNFFAERLKNLLIEK